VIVISGALVLVALVLLVLGLTMTDLDFVYGSIAVSLVSFVFLVIGILQRRGEPAAGSASDAPAVSDDAAPPAEAVPAASARTRAARRAPEPVDDGVLEDDDADALLAEPSGPVVLVVPGRPRYHVEGCRYLAGKDVEEVPVDLAREDYSPCGVCKPEDALAAEDEPVEEVLDSGVPGAADAEADLAPEAVAPRRGRGSTRTATAPAATPARAATAPAKAPAKGAKPAKAAKAPSKAAAKAAASTPGAAPAEAPAAAPAKASARRGRVVVIPDRGKFHAPDCRFVRDALGTEELTRTQAGKQGYAPCGVCKP
jgi:hypothetical protein